MTHEDAAKLLCAMLGSENVKDSVGTVASMRGLAPNFRGRQGSGYGAVASGISPDHDVVSALAQVLRVFDREEELPRHYELRDARFYALFEVQYPQHYAFITIGLRRRFKETWTYGRRGTPLKEQVRRARDRQLREIARALRSSGTRAD